jgi:hypothetical protein
MPGPVMAQAENPALMLEKGKALKFKGFRLYLGS